MDHDMGRAAMVYPHETECSLGQTRRRRLLARLRHAAMSAVRSLLGKSGRSADIAFLQRMTRAGAS